VKSLLLHLGLFLLLTAVQAGAVEEVISGSDSFNTSAPTNSDVANWNTGWAAGGITGWNYVGQVNGASAVYLGNDWVLTAGHVGSGTFALSGSFYSPVPGSAQGITVSGSQADITLFQISTAPVLPSLTISGTSPAPFTGTQPGDQLVMIGYGGGHGQTWGLNTVTDTNISVTLGPDYPFDTNDFETEFGTITRSGSSITNNYQFIIGDSGGGDFTYNSLAGTWQLSGINEAIDSDNNGYMVDLSTYSSQIDGITGIPEPSSLALLGAGLLTLLCKYSPLRKSCEH